MKIVLTENAERSYIEIISKYSEVKASLFAAETILILDMIEKNNNIGSGHKKTPYRKFLVSEQVYLFYRIDIELIYIVLFWNNKRNPLDLEIVLSS
ncbi:type II toxin-antitoxin system RelE/ParE family toxin [Flavobacterium sp. WC2509]|uniref:type II toxin-antitoxin system RelE/ParE family toxin n=1 Tax=Flavobacterium sp. WC2509 TaxID=3461406 RepID=UPI0040449E2A